MCADMIRTLKQSLNHLCYYLSCDLHHFDLPLLLTDTRGQFGYYSYVYNNVL